MNLMRRIAVTAPLGQAVLGCSCHSRLSRGAPPSPRQTKAGGVEGVAGARGVGGEAVLGVVVGCGGRAGRAAPVAGAGDGLQALPPGQVAQGGVGGGQVKQVGGAAAGSPAMMVGRSMRSAKISGCARICAWIRRRSISRRSNCARWDTRPKALRAPAWANSSL